MDGDSKESRGEATRRKLILAGIKLFSKYGFDSTTTRMLAQHAGVNLSSISFHFSNKVALYNACLQLIADKAEDIYHEAFTNAENVLANEEVGCEEAKAAIFEIMNLQFNVAFGKRYRSSLMLAYWEQVNPTQGIHPVTNLIFSKIEQTVAKLISRGANIPYKKALIASRFLNGGIVSFGEHSILVKYSIGAALDDEEMPQWVRRQIFSHMKCFINELFENGIAEE